MLKFKQLFAVACMLVLCAGNALAVGTFVSAPNRVDMVHDAARDIVYITSGGQSLIRYQVSTNTYLPPYVLPGAQLNGADLSPDGNFLAVADKVRSEQVWVWRIDLRDGSAVKYIAPRTFGEGGTFTAAYGADGTLLVTSKYEGSGWTQLRKFDVSGVVTDLGTVTQDVMLASSGDRTKVAFAEANISDGRWGMYTVSTGALDRRQWYVDGTSWFNYEVGANSNGTQTSIPTYGGTFVYDAAFQKIATIGVYAGQQPIGVAYHPVEPIAYFPFVQTTLVKVFDMNSFAETAALDFGSTFVNNGNHAFTNGRTKISGDGSLLMVSVAGGVQIYRQYAPLSAQDTAVTTQKNSIYSGILAGSVGNSGRVTYAISQQPAMGTVTLNVNSNGDRFAYYSPQGFVGADAFKYTATYGRTTVEAEVAITIVESNRAPVAYPQVVFGSEDNPVAVVLSGSDADGDQLTYSLVALPQYGVLSGAAPNLLYTPGANFTGSDSFSFQARDGLASSNIATVSVSIEAVNDAPIVVDRAISTNEDMPVNITLTAADIDSTAFTFTITQQPSRGTLVGSPPSLLYVPADNFAGQDSFSYQASDGQASSNVGTVTITVTPVNDAPVVPNRSVTTNEDTAVGITLTSTDVDSTALSYIIVRLPTNGTLSGTLPSLVYVPALNFSGTDSFTYAATDGSLQSNVATVTLNVSSVNDAPVARADTATVVRGNSVTIPVLSNDTDFDGDVLTITQVAAPANGTATIVGNNIVFKANKSFFGSLQFSYTISDGRGGTANAAVTVTITK